MRCWQTTVRGSHVTFPVEWKLTFSKTFTFKACNVWNRCFNLPEIICIINPTCGLSDLPKSRWQYGMNRITNLTHHWDWFDLTSLDLITPRGLDRKEQRAMKYPMQPSKTISVASVKQPPCSAWPWTSVPFFRTLNWEESNGCLFGGISDSECPWFSESNWTISPPMLCVWMMSSWPLGFPLTPGTRRCYSWEHICLSVYFQA